MKKGIEALNAITEVVLAYRPPRKKKKAKKVKTGPSSKSISKSKAKRV
jgi:hypothetical protein